MNDYCAFSKSHKCLKWTDYELTRYELEKADKLCHCNQIEIQKLNDYIELLQSLLDKNEIEYPDI
ncbi:mobility-associated LCxxNW protein [Ruminococcus sp. XPD3002]|uniref:mobility-associated LCxxNW protein n=1 Tax=Ruminococcus sp. XPD3002 TaxID=1452269 RepID=UPI0009223DC5|nr:hypothetical protein SAMN04487832_1058 [Ruminococcus flavefaciens]